MLYEICLNSPLRYNKKGAVKKGYKKYSKGVLGSRICAHFRASALTRTMMVI